MKVRVLFTVIGMAFQFCLHAQSRQTVNQFADWFSATSSIKTSSRFALLVDTQFRFVKGTEAMQHQIRLGGDIKISDRFSLMPLGYVFVWNYQYGKQPMTYVNNEHRLFQQFVYKHKAGSFRLQHRLRTEERFLQKHYTDTGGAEVDEGFVNKQFRIRYRAYCTIPITRQADPSSMGIDPKSWYILVYDEFFVSWGEFVTYNEIDQNRIFVGLGYQFTKDFTVQAGPFYQLLIKANGAQQENNIGIGTWLTYNWDLTN